MNEELYKRIEELRAILQYLHDIGLTWMEKAQKSHTEKKDLEVELEKTRAELAAIRELAKEKDATITSQQEAIAQWEKNSEADKNAVAAKDKLIVNLKKNYDEFVAGLKTFKEQIQQRDGALNIAASFSELQDLRERYKKGISENEEAGKKLNVRIEEQDARAKELAGRQELLEQREGALKTKEEDCANAKAAYEEAARKLRLQADAMRKANPELAAMGNTHRPGEQDSENPNDMLEKLIREKDELKAEILAARLKQPSFNSRDNSRQGDGIAHSRGEQGSEMSSKTIWGDKGGEKSLTAEKTSENNFSNSPYAGRTGSGGGTGSGISEGVERGMKTSDWGTLKPPPRDAEESDGKFSISGDGEGNSGGDSQTTPHPGKRYIKF